MLQVVGPVTHVGVYDPATQKHKVSEPEVYPAEVSNCLFGFIFLFAGLFHFLLFWFGSVLVWSES